MQAIDQAEYARGHLSRQCGGDHLEDGAAPMTNQTCPCLDEPFVKTGQSPLPELFPQRGALHTTGVNCCGGIFRQQHPLRQFRASYRATFCINADKRSRLNSINEKHPLVRALAQPLVEPSQPQHAPLCAAIHIVETGTQRGGKLQAMPPNSLQATKNSIL